VRASAGRKRRAVWVTDRDRETLSFLAEHRHVLASQVRVLFGVSRGATDDRLRELAKRRLLTRTEFSHEVVCQITRRGLDAIASDLPTPRWWLGNYEHDVGIAWVWIAAHAGTFGAVREMVSERAMRSRDGRPGSDPYGVRLGGVARNGRERVHYPDLLLFSAAGERVAVELELGAKERFRREGILAGYASDDRIDRVLYLVEERGRVGGSVIDSARRLGISGLVRVQPVRWTSPLSAGPRGGGVRSRQDRASGRDL
jgi:hypothetical protein